MAFNFVFQSNLSHNQLLVASDPLSSLLAMTEPSYDRNICPTILNLLQRPLHSLDIRKSFMWIPNHSGIVNNERVNKAARAACSLQSIKKYPLINPNFFSSIAHEENEVR